MVWFWLDSIYKMVRLWDGEVYVEKWMIYKVHRVYSGQRGSKNQGKLASVTTRHLVHSFGTGNSWASHCYCWRDSRLYFLEFWSLGSLGAEPFILSPPPLFIEKNRGGACRPAHPGELVASWWRFLMGPVLKVTPQFDQFTPILSFFWLISSWNVVKIYGLCGDEC